MVVMATCFTCSSTPSPKSNFEFDFGFISSAPKPPRVMFAPFTGDRVRSVVYCFRCCKPRCIYAQKQLSTREKILLEEITANNVFSCGSPLLPPIHPLCERISMKIFRSCDEPIEVAFYSSNLDTMNLCCYCGSSESTLSEETDTNRRQLPMCDQCKLLGRETRSLLPVKRSKNERGHTHSGTDENRL